MTDTTKDIADLREVAGTGETSDWMTWPKVDPAKLKRVLDQLEAERQRAVKLDDRAKCAEAERDKNIAWHSKQLKRANDLEAKLAALKGNQVPFRYMAEWSSQYGGMEYDYSEVRSEMDEVAAEHDGSVIELFTAPQKPVVLPQAHKVRAGVTLTGDESIVMIPCNNGNWLSRFDVEHAIKMAGGIVKVGE